jgi:hypothetical protein
MKARILGLMAVAFLAHAAASQTLIACSCEIANTVCLTDVEMSEHAMHIQMEPDRMGNHSHYSGVAVFQIGFDEYGRVTGASATSGHPLGISPLMAAVSKWRFKPVIQKGVKKQACGRLSIEFAMEENVPSVRVLFNPTIRSQKSIDDKSPYHSKPEFQANEKRTFVITPDCAVYGLTHDSMQRSIE